MQNTFYLRGGGKKNEDLERKMKNGENFITGLKSLKKGKYHCFRFISVFGQKTGCFNNFCKTWLNMPHMIWDKSPQHRRMIKHVL